jgi:hypothetical protein
MDEQTKQRIVEWVDTDNIIRTRKEKLKLLYDKKAKLENEIKTYVKRNNLTDFKIRISDGHIRFTEKNNLQAISQKYLKESLEDFFKAAANNKNIAVNADTVYEFILKNRKSYTAFEMTRDIKESPI